MRSEKFVIAGTDGERDKVDSMVEILDISKEAN